jgi:drug/metabolite transporter (DMT)-like permease
MSVIQSAISIFTRGKTGMLNIAIIYILISVVSGAVGQILLKTGMNSVGALTLNLSGLPSILWRMGTNPYVFIGLVVYVGGVVFWLAALSRVDLSYAYPFASLSYGVMLLASWRLFDEDITGMRMLGTLVVMLGVFLISRS